VLILARPTSAIVVAVVIGVRSLGFLLVLLFLPLILLPVFLPLILLSFLLPLIVILAPIGSCGIWGEKPSRRSTEPMPAGQGADSPSSEKAQGAAPGLRGGQQLCECIDGGIVHHVDSQKRAWVAVRH
jgi:hypothetical protein